MRQKMAMMICNECGAEISRSARRCPKCGKYIWSTGRVGCALLIVPIIFFFALIFSTCMNTCSKVDEYRSKAKANIKKSDDEQSIIDKSFTIDSTARQKLIKESFNTEDGSHVGLTAFIKSHMNNPDSYNHITTKHQDYGDNLLIETQFNSTGDSGVLIKRRIKAEVDLSGNVVKIIEHNP